MLLILLAGCWKTDVSIDTTIIPFENATSNTAGWVERVDSALACPDGNPASIYLVYPQTQEGPLPGALVLHSGAFDYIQAPAADNPLLGQNYAGVDDAGLIRLEADWASQKVFEAMGLIPRIDASEDNLGTMASALLDAGYIGIYPTNCWGDLWHNETPSAGLPNLSSNSELDFFARNGGALAADAWDFASGESLMETGALLDTSSTLLIGLGEGSRGATELMMRDGVNPAGLLIDSPIDELEDWAADDAAVAEGLRRIYLASDAEDYNWNQWTMARMASAAVDELPDIPVAVVYSSIDPQVPAGNITRLSEKFEADTADRCEIDTEATKHVQSNGNIVLARDLVTFLGGGDKPAQCADQ